MKRQESSHGSKYQQKQQLNIIRQTRKIIKNMTQEQRFQKALCHVKDALYFRHPRPDSYSLQQTNLFKICYKIQTSPFWYSSLVLITYVYFYIIALDMNYHATTVIVVESIILAIYWIDVALYLYHKSFQKIRISSKFQLRFYIKIGVLSLLVLDLILFAIYRYNDDVRYLTLFRFVRGLLPILYDSMARKTVQSFLMTYKDTIVFLFFFFAMIASTGLIANQIIQYPSNWRPDVQYDQYKSGYNVFLRSCYVIYALLSQDNYPDNQYPAIKWSEWVYAYFILIVLLNRNFFTVIPGTIIFNSFRQARSKTILIGQIRQQHSLILAFVSLAKQNDQIDIKTLIKFLFYMYHNNIRYIDNITQICIKLDYNNSGTIQVKQFLQLTRILTKHSHLLPSQFRDFQIWVKFTRFIKDNLGVDKIVRTWWYRFCSNLVVLLTFINCIALIVEKKYWLSVTDNVFSALFVLDVLMKLVGLGYISFFNNSWNKLDFYLVSLILLLDVLPVHVIPYNSDVLLKMIRIFRINQLLSLFEELRGIQNPGIINRNSMYGMLRKLLTQTALVIPVTLQFFPLLFITYYYCGILGMEFFYHTQRTTQPTSRYGMYAQFDNFKRFLGSQYIMMQVLVQHGWSQVTFDYVTRTDLFFPIILYFMICHAFITNILTGVLKSLIWDAYTYIQQQFQQSIGKQQQQRSQQVKYEQKKQQFAQIRQTIQQNGFIIPNTVIKRQFLQNKLNNQIFKRLKQLYDKKMLKFNGINSSKNIMERMVIENKKYLIDQFESSESQRELDQQMTMNRIYDKIISRKILENSFNEGDQLDFQHEMKGMLQKIILHPRTKYSDTMIYPKILLELIQQKMVRPYQDIPALCSERFNLNTNMFDNNQSALNFHMYELNMLMNIETSSRDQKLKVIKYMIENQLTSQEQAKKLFLKDQFEKKFQINSNWIIRKMFLGQTNEKMIKKFKIEYFSNIYGTSFKDINKVTIEPLLRYEALLLYNFKNIMRYPQMSSINFFQLLNTIQDKISNYLQKKGSLFKFVYQIQSFSDNWFTIQHNSTQDIKIHFIKTGIWIYNKNMQQNQIYFARDIFKWNISERQDRPSCQKILKLLHETFQSLAFGLPNHTNFFQYDPTTHECDLYSFFIDVNKVKRYNKQNKLTISKIMLVIMSKQEEREEPLDYYLTEINYQSQKQNRINLDAAQAQDQAFNNLKNLSAMDRETIIQNQGLPFTYLLNLMTEMKDCLNLYAQTMVNQVQNVLNEQFQKK